MFFKKKYKIYILDEPFIKFSRTPLDLSYTDSDVEQLDKLTTVLEIHSRILMNGVHKEVLNNGFIKDDVSFLYVLKNTDFRLMRDKKMLKRFIDDINMKLDSKTPIDILHLYRIVREETDNKFLTKYINILYKSLEIISPSPNTISENVFISFEELHKRYPYFFIYIALRDHVSMLEGLSKVKKDTA